MSTNARVLAPEIELGLDDLCKAISMHHAMMKYVSARKSSSRWNHLLKNTPKNVTATKIVNRARINMNATTHPAPIVYYFAPALSPTARIKKSKNMLRGLQKVL